MAGELRHNSVGTNLTQSEFESLTLHALDSQARGDIVISNTAATGLIRLARHATTGAVLVNGATDPAWDDSITAGSGVLTITDGGTVTQITSITTAVTLNARGGLITTVSATLAAGATAEFTVNNSTITTADAVICHVQDYTGTGRPVVWVTFVAAGSFGIRIRNDHASDALNDVMTIRFVTIRGSNT